MNTPIADFVKRYVERDYSRLHMPGHKGRPILGCEPWDITEIRGADALYEAQGIIAQSEKNAASLFDSGATLYSTEGSSQCLKAMLCLSLLHRKDKSGRPVALAARNAHKSLIHAAALCDFDLEWLWPEGDAASPCACPLTPDGLRRRLSSMETSPFCVLVTSPDYLGGMQDIRGLSAVCHECEIPLLVDNAHGAYLRFLAKSLHPLDLGADMCCDSAHKTLPVLTGGAYLHLSKDFHCDVSEAKSVLGLFGSTSPSYLILQSLDLLNARLAGDYPDRIANTARKVSDLRKSLRAAIDGEPLKLTLMGEGRAMADALHRGGVECEYADQDYAVLMFSPENRESDYEKVEGILKDFKPQSPQPLIWPIPPRALTPRQAIFAPSRQAPLSEAVGQICAAPTVACPPAIPIAVSGEIITPEVAAVFERCGIDKVKVITPQY